MIKGTLALFSTRSLEKELLDLGPNYYTPEEFVQCQKALFRINTLLGFFKDTVFLLKKFPTHTTVLDVGCGGGLFLLQLKKKFPNFVLRGIDISADAIQVADNELTAWLKTNSNLQVTFEQKNIFDEQQTADVVITTLVCHHLNNDELIDFLKKSFSISRKLIIINDLHRHRLAHFFYRILSRFFNNRLITHDGLVSIRRSFVREDWHKLLLTAGIKNYEIKRRFPFRWQVLIWKN